MITLRLLNNTFENIKSGKVSIIKHGFSRNKKYTRLFGVIEQIELFNEDKTESIIKSFERIDILQQGEKNIFQITLK